MTEATDNYGNDGLSRLDRIEALLAQSVQQAAEHRQQSDERLSRIEALQERTQQQIDSNARAIAANSDNTAEAREATMTLARLLRDAVAILMDRLERIEQRLNGGNGNGAET